MTVTSFEAVGSILVVAMLIVLELVVTASRSARNAYRFDIFPREERVSSNAYFRAARNVGYTLGALLAGIALAPIGKAVVRRLLEDGFCVATFSRDERTLAESLASFLFCIMSARTSP